MAISVDPMRPMRYSFTVDLIDRPPPPYTPPAQPKLHRRQRRPPDRAVAEPIRRGFCLPNFGPPSSSLAPFISPNISPKNLTGRQTESMRILAGGTFSVCARICPAIKRGGMHRNGCPISQVQLQLQEEEGFYPLTFVCTIRWEEIFVSFLCKKRVVQKLRSTNKYT